MKAFVAYKPGELRFIEVEKPTPGPRDLLCAVRHCGVCATDSSIADGTLNLGEGNMPWYPVRMGHEWSGVVVEKGCEVRNFEIGDRVISDTGCACGKCDNCVKGDYGSCAHGRAIGTTNNHWPGAMAEYMLIPEFMAFRIPDSVEMDEAALVEPATIGLFGLVRALLGPECTMVVVGTGAIGLGGMALAKGMGAGKVILAGRRDEKLEIGRRMGADVLVNMARENLAEAVARETGGAGADTVMDTTGAAELLNQSIALTRGSGFLVIPGFYEKLLDGVALDSLIAANRTLVGAAGTALMGGKVLKMLAEGKATLKPMITDRFPFEQAPLAFAAMKERSDTRVKVMLDFD